MLKILSPNYVAGNPFFNNKMSLILPFMYAQQVQKHCPMLNRIRRLLCVKA
jgi:hypothetical protein